jgi:carbonic anhydrase
MGSMEGGTIVSIEYAVIGLQVKDVVICGHSDCGAMKGILHPEEVSQVPSRKWVEHAKVAREAGDKPRSYEILEPVRRDERGL